MAREGHGSTWESVKYGKFVGQFQPDIKTIRPFERIETKIFRVSLSVISNHIYQSISIYTR